MATLAFALIGAAAGSAMGGTAFTIMGSAVTFASIGGWMGSIVGSYIDNTYLYPALMGNQNKDIQGQRMGDFEVQTGSEGTAIKRFLGERSPQVAGNVIWLPDSITETKIEEETGGKGGGKGGQTVVSWEYSMSCAIAFGEGPVNSIQKIWADSKLIYDVLADPPFDQRYKAIRLYLGGWEQPVDAFLDEVTGGAPAYRGIVYIVIEELQLADWGNRLPTFKVLVETEEGASIRGEMDRAFQQHMWWPNYYDVSALSTEAPHYGMTYSGPQNLAKVLEPNFLAYNLIAIDNAGVLQIKQREDITVWEVTGADLAAHEPGSDAPRMIPIKDGPSKELPMEVNVNYISPSTEYQQASQRDRRRHPVAPVVNVIDLPLVLPDSEAKKIAQRNLWSPWSEREQPTITLMPRWMGIQENDVLKVTADTEIVTMRVTKVEEGWNRSVVVSGVVEQDGILLPAHHLPGTDPDNPPTDPPVGPPSDPTLYILDIPPLTDEHAKTLGFYYAADWEGDWRGGVLMVEGVAGTYTQVGRLAKGVLGKALGALSGSGAHTLALDVTNTVSVELVSGSLSSYPRADVMNGKNWALLGDEIIAFETATLTAPLTYTLSNIWRGVRDTIDHKDSHATNERFVLLDPSAIRFAKIDSAKLGIERNYKAVPVWALVGDITAVPATVYGECCRPFRPFEIHSTHASDGAITVTWKHSSRLWWPINSTARPLDEAVESYKVWFKETTDTDPDHFLHEYVVSSPSSTYSAAHQIADGRTAGDTIRVIVRQIGAIIPQGNAERQDV